MTWFYALSARDRRILALALLGLLVFLLYAVILGPVLASQSALNAEIETARKQLGRLETMLIRSMESMSGATGTPAQITWEGASPSVIAANVQKQIQSLAQASDITVVSISQTETRFSDDFLTAGLVIEGHGEIAAFVDLFTAVERSQPALFIDNLLLRRYQSPNGSQPGSRLPLSARFEIHAPHQLGVDG
jgi:hypothetical protein